MPKLWTETIEAHRREVRDAILDTTATLIHSEGLLSVSMSQIAEETGIGRATLYKYFSDVESILRAWHEREITKHLGQLADARDRHTAPRERLRAVLETYAAISRASEGHHDTELAALMHRDQQVIRAEDTLRAMIRDLVADAQKAGEAQRELSADDLASYCLHALTAAKRMRTRASVARLIDVILNGIG